MPTNLQIMAADAKQAIDMLKGLQQAYMRGVITYAEVQERGNPQIDIFNSYSKALAKECKVKYRPISLGYFLR